MAQSKAVEKIEAHWDHDRLKRDRLALVQAELERQGIGALYLRDGLHVRYLLDLDVPGGWVFVPVEGEVVVVIRSERDLGFVRAQNSNVELGRDGISQVRELMAQHGVGGERLGVDTMAPERMFELAETGVGIVGADNVVEPAWSVKTSDEVTMIRAIGRQYVQTLEAFRDAIHPGITEQQLATHVTRTWLDVGGEDVAQLNVCSAENMNPWRRWPTARALEAAELVGIDLHARGFGGIRGDASTTFLVGNSGSAEQRDLYRAAHEYLQGAIPQFRAGRPLAEVAAAMPPIADRYQELQALYGPAHGNGLGSSGMPHFRRESPTEDVLLTNQFLAIEVYFAEVGSPLTVKLEEQIMVGDGEPEVIGAIPVDERLLG